VAQFQRELESELNALLGREVSIFFDEKQDVLVASVPAALLAALRDSAILVALLSPSYLTSAWCQRERTEFLSNLPKQDAPVNRLAPILIRPIENSDLDSVLSNVQHLSFLGSDGQGPFAPGSLEMAKRVRDFAGQLTRVLRNLGPLASAESPSDRTVRDLLRSFDVSKSCVEIVDGAARYSQKGMIGVGALLRSALDYGRAQPQSSSTAAAFLFKLVSEKAGTPVVVEPPGESKPSRSIDTYEISAGVWNAFANAKRIRSETGGQDQYLGFRHILFALTVTPDSRTELDIALQPLAGVDAEWLASELVPFLRRSLEKNESWYAWLHIFQRENLKLPGAAEEAPQPAPSDSPASEPTEAQLPPGVWEGEAFAGYQADDPNTGDDLLGIANEAEALASVLAAKNIDPPLSLGLFGEWGSGKSFFMRLIEKRVAELRDDAKAVEGQSAYCEDIVQLNFNAWSYIDSNLWASLTAKIFEGLAGALAEKRTGGKDTQEERDIVMAAVSSSQNVIAAAEQRKLVAESELTRVETELDRLQKNAMEIEARLTPAELFRHAFAFAFANREVQKYLGEAAEQLNLAEGEAVAVEVKKQILELHDTTGILLFAVRNNKKLWV